MDDVTPLQVLIVEDASSVAGLIQLFLQRSGLVAGQGGGAFVVGSLAQALEHASAHPPDVVLLDVSLPDANGLQAVAALRNVVQAAPVLVLTDRDDAEFAAEVLRAGAQDYLVKGTLDKKTLERAVRYAIERERIEARLKLLDSALEAASNAVVITDAEATIEWANPAFTVLTGFSKGEALGLNPKQLIRSGRNSNALYEELWTTILSGKTWCGELINRRKDGSFYDEEMSITPVTDVRGKIHHFIAIKQDISERKRAQLALQESEQRLELALAGADLGLWDWNVASGERACNARWAEMLGFSLAEVSQRVADWDKRIHPDDLPSVKKALEAHLGGETPNYEAEYRMLHKAEHWVWILDRGKVVARDAEGKPLRALGTHLDISERKHAEVALREREAKLATLLASMPDLVFQVDTSGNLTGCHQPAGNWFFTAPPLEGLSYSRVTPPAVVEALDEALAGIIGDGQPRVCELTAPAGGEEHHFQMTVNQLADSSRFPSGFLVVVRDVTERRLAEQKIRDLAYYDTLTNLPNRRLLMDRLQLALATAERTGNFGALLFIDLDRFKDLNDTHGHAIGDQFLAEVAERLQQCLRAGDTAARLGGDEFVVMLPELSNDRKEAEARAGVVCDKMIAVLEHPCSLADESCQCSASIGVSIFQARGQNPAEILRCADQAMYEAKAAGRAAWCLAK
ncbi:MAG: two component transcriptional regulator, LuxR family [Proteobacteria bacterium]|nr:two component transcriptional regulator, LuxR family [Pseudomonadota bacterium]